jgi:hypothetical protein
MRGAPSKVSKYLEQQDVVFSGLRTQMENELKPLHKKIRLNNLRHMALEMSARWEEFVADYDTMMVEEPLYRVKLGGPEVEYKGTDGVRDFYAGLDPVAVMLTREDTAIADWGLAARVCDTILLKGSDLADDGLARDLAGDKIDAVSDPDAIYALEMIPIAMFWPYTADGRLAGEEIYQIGGPERLVECAPEDLVTKADIADALKPYCDL